jgi:hypothetical protein
MDVEQSLRRIRGVSKGPWCQGVSGAICVVDARSLNWNCNCNCTIIISSPCDLEFSHDHIDDNLTMDGVKGIYHV